MRVLFFGSSEFAVPTFESIRDGGHTLVGAVTQPDRVRGRGQTMSPTPVKKMALSCDVPVFTPENVNTAETVEQLKSLGADVGYVASFGQKFGREMLEAFPAGLINLHASLLPALRGAAPIQWAIINGDAATGVTVFRIVEKMDAGPVLTQRRTAIGNDETTSELHDRLARIGCDAVRAALEALEADPNLPGDPQDASQATVAPKLKKADGRITFDQPAQTIARRICGLWTWPGASCRYVAADGSRDELVTLARAVRYEGQSSPAASPEDIGRLTDMMSVQVGDGELAILEIKPANGKLQSWQDFVNGRRVKPGDRLAACDSG